MNNTIPETYKAWLAGFFDGEGSISLLMRSQSELRVPRAVLSQKNALEVMNEIQRNYGGNIYFREKDRMHQWYVGNRTDLKKFLLDVIPYLKIKKAKAEIALAICNLMGSQGTNVSDQDKQTRVELEEKFEALREGRVQ